MEVKGTLIAIRETEYWDETTLEKYGIADAFGLYVVPDDGGNTVDVIAGHVENVFMHWLEVPEHLRDEAREELAYESGDREFLMRAALDGDPRFRVRLSVDEDEDEERHTMADLDTLMDSVVTGTQNEPAILEYTTWAAWRRETQEKRRARNMPPVSNWGANGTVNLPLFVHAMNQLAAEHMPAFERLDAMHGGCAASHALQKRAKAEGFHWNL